MKLWLITAAVVFAGLSASATENIRVAITDNQSSVSLQSSTGLLREGQGSAGAVRKLVLGNGSIGSAPVRIRSADGIVRVNGRSYRGTVEVRKKKNGTLLVVNDLD
ncbi:MAG TPA: hypothetical protein VN604_00270, partial [Nitrospirota bacterium]|nr:hypothetical protein [Nitrospirota bacterium]